MRYFTTEELKTSNREEVRKKLSGCCGKNVKYNFALAVFSKYLNGNKAGKDACILDIGTASGAFLKQLSNSGYKNLYAHDVDYYMPDHTQKLLKEYKITDLNTAEIPWPSNYFDAVTAWCVLPHLENPFHAARELRRVIKPGGVLMFTTPHLTSKSSISYFLKNKNFASYRPTNNHIALLTQSILEKTVFRGFELIGKEYLVTPKAFLGWKGQFRRSFFRLIGFNKNFKRKIEHRWAYNVCYVIKKV